MREKNIIYSMKKNLFSQPSPVFFSDARKIPSNCQALYGPLLICCQLSGPFQLLKINQTHEMERKQINVQFFLLK